VSQLLKYGLECCNVSARVCAYTYQWQEDSLLTFSKDMFVDALMRAGGICNYRH